jgi:DNA-binding NtrC family response regulator
VGNPNAVRTEPPRRRFDDAAVVLDDRQGGPARPALVEAGRAAPAVVLVQGDDATAHAMVVAVLAGGPVGASSCGRSRRPAVVGPLCRAVSAVQAAFDDPDLAVVLLDFAAAERTAWMLLEGLRRRRPDVVVLGVTDGSSVDLVVRMVKAGVFDHVRKPFDDHERLGAVLAGALERRVVERPVAVLERQRERDRMAEIVGASPAMQPVFDTILAVADAPATVLVTGESGTGKELVARALHRLGGRAAKPFVAVNCSAFADGLLESELFGHVRGAFTGAVAPRRGVFEAAHGGTLFLDEIGDISPRMQVSLLRALQEGEIRRVGSNDTIRVDVRLIAATNRDLPAAIRQGLWRDDLYYRLNVVGVHLPSLRQRRSDIPLLAAHLLQRHVARMQRPIQGFTRPALDRLCAWSWPGNVRELDNVIARAVVLCRGTAIDERDLPPDLVAIAAPPASPPPMPDDALATLQYVDAKRRVVTDFERRYLRAQLDAAGGNISRAAALAGLDRSNFKRLCRTFGIALQESSGRSHEDKTTPVQ